MNINAIETLYNAPRLFVIQNISLSIPQIVFKSFFNASVGSFLGAGILYTATKAVSPTLLAAKVAALVTHVASLFFYTLFYYPRFSQEQINLLANKPAPHDDAESFKKTIHLIATEKGFEEFIKQGTYPPSYQFAPQLEAFRLAQELGDAALQMDCEEYLCRSIEKEAKSEYFYMAECYGMPKLKNLVLKKLCEQCLNDHDPFLEIFVTTHSIHLVEWEGGSLTNDQLNHLRTLAPHLKKITIHTDQNFTQEGIIALSDLSELQSLSVTGAYAFQPDALRSLLTLNHLQKINIDSSQLPLESIVLLSRIPGLKSLSLRGGQHFTEEVFQRIAQNPQLKQLNLTDFNLNDNGVRSLAALRLNKFSLHSSRPGGLNLSLQPEARLPHLTALSLHGCHLDENTVQAIASHARLERLSITNSSLSDAQATSLARLSALKHINFSKCHELTAAGINAFQAHPHLKEMNLSDCGIAMQHTQLNPNLEALNLRNARFIPLEQIHALEQLKKLNLSKTGLNDQIIYSFENLPELTELDIRFSEPLSKGALKHIATIYPKLKKINLHEIFHYFPGHYDKLTALEALKELTLVTIPHQTTIAGRIGQLIQNS